MDIRIYESMLFALFARRSARNTLPAPALLSSTRNPRLERTEFTDPHRPQLTSSVGSFLRKGWGSGGEGREIGKEALGPECFTSRVASDAPPSRKSVAL